MIEVLSTTAKADMTRRQREAYGNDFGVRPGEGYRQRLENTMRADGIKEGTKTWRTGIIASDEDNNSSEGKCATPIAAPEGGKFNERQEVSLSCDTQGAAIHYTTNGQEPNKDSTVYKSPILIDRVTTLKAIAIKDSLEDSDILTEEYNINAQEAAKTAAWNRAALEAQARAEKARAEVI